MQEAPTSEAEILPEHCELADELHDVVPVSVMVQGVTPTDPSQSGSSPEGVVISYQYASPTGGLGRFEETTVKEDKTLQLPNLPKAWSATFSDYSLNPNKSCQVDPSSVSTPTTAVHVDITCTCTSTSNLEALGLDLATTTDCPFDFPQETSKFDPFLPLWPIFADSSPWYLDSFGPFVGDEPIPCQRQTVCTEGRTEVTLDNGEIIVTDVLNCVDQCVDSSTVALHGPSVKVTLPDGTHAGDGTLTVDGYAVDSEGTYDLAFYVDQQPATLSGLNTGLYRPEACTEVAGANRSACSPYGGFRGTLDATALEEGTHRIQVIALDSGTGYPMATLAQREFTVPGCFDSTRPTISWTSPAAGSTVSGTVTLSASAADDVGVKRVALFVDGVRVANDFAAPYTHAWDTTTVTNGTHTLMARAFDACGNWRGTKQNVTVHNITPCQADYRTLCFLEDRFSARLTISDQTGRTIPFTETGGFFYLADPDNVEVAVKMLDGRSSNGRFWLFHGSLTSQPYTLTVTDTHTGRVRTYANTGLCGGADVASFVDSSALLFGRLVYAGTCTSTTRSVCLMSNRFRVEVLAGGEAQHGVAVTPETGSFGFINTSTPEVVVKILDGTAVNGYFWVFYGSLTDQNYQVRVTDTVTGLVQAYGAPGAFCGNADVSAF